MTTQGLKLPVDANFATRLETAQLWDGTRIPAGLKARLQRGWAQLEFLNRTIEELDAERAALTADPQTTMGRYIHALPPFAGSVRSAPGPWPPKSLGGDRLKTGGNWAAWWAWCRPRIRAARAATIKASRAQAINMSVASWCNSPGAGSGTSRTVP